MTEDPQGSPQILLLNLLLDKDSNSMSSIDSSNDLKQPKDINELFNSNSRSNQKSTLKDQAPDLSNLLNQSKVELTTCKQRELKGNLLTFSLNL